jgi:hypothetical protein
MTAERKYTDDGRLEGTVSKEEWNQAYHKAWAFKKWVIVVEMILTWPISFTVIYFFDKYHRSLWSMILVASIWCFLMFFYFEKLLKRFKIGLRDDR